MAKLVLDKDEYLIILEDAGDGCPEGYWVGHAGINEPIYGRGSRQNALVMDKDSAEALINDFRSSGYPCHAEPPFSVTYHY